MSNARFKRSQAELAKVRAFHAPSAQPPKHVTIGGRTFANPKAKPVTEVEPRCRIGLRPDHFWAGPKLGLPL